MRFDSLPDIPDAEHPEHQWLKEKAKEAVAEKIAGLDIGLDLGRHPEVVSRLAELGSHFEDSVVMARMIRTIYGPLRDQLGLTDDGPERLMRSAVLHDIGKSGPPGVETGLHDAIRRLFIPPGRPFNPYIDGRTKTIREFIDEQQLPNGDAIAAELKKAGIDADNEAMIVFWRRHAEWTHGLLAAESGPDIDEDMIKIAASHHLLEDQNPAKLEIADIPAEAHVLEILEEAELLEAVDKYQAYRRRGALRHEDVIARLNARIDARPDLPDALRQKFRTVIGVLGRSKDELERHFGPDRSAK